MATVPTGSPAWARANDHTVYGGHTDKINYQSQGVVNPQTDVGAEGYCRIAADMEAVHRTAPFVVLRLLCNDSSPAAPTIQLVNQMTGIRSTSYAGGSAPSGFPSGARNGNGDVTLTWASSYTDSYSVSASVNISHATAQLHGATAGDVTIDIAAANVLRVRAFNAAGAALSDALVTVTVCTGT